MKKIVGIILLMVFVVSMFGCGGGKKMVKEDNVPDWFLNAPSDPDYLYAANSATSSRMQIAIDKAKSGARLAIAQQLEVKVKGLTKKFEEEIGSGDNTELNEFFSQTMKSITSQSLNGSRISKKEIDSESSGQYRAYVLMELPLNDLKANIVKSVKKNKNLYERFRASKAFDEMNKEVKDFEKSQKE